MGPGPGFCLLVCRGGGVIRGEGGDLGWKEGQENEGEDWSAGKERRKDQGDKIGLNETAKGCRIQRRYSDNVSHVVSTCCEGTRGNLLLRKEPGPHTEELSPLRRGCRFSSASSEKEENVKETPSGHCKENYKYPSEN